VPSYRHANAVSTSQALRRDCQWKDSMDALTSSIDGHCDGHVADVEFVDRFHTEILECDHASRFNGLSDKVRGSADGAQISRPMRFDSLNGDLTALRLPDCHEQSCFRQ